jgi:hypothetical protein
VGAKDPEQESTIEPNVINSCTSSRGSGSGPKSFRHNATEKERKKWISELSLFNTSERKQHPLPAQVTFFPFRGPDRELEVDT